MNMPTKSLFPISLFLIEGFLLSPVVAIADWHPEYQLVSYPIHWTITRPANPLFTGREELLAELEGIARDVVENTSRQDPSCIVISGMGGQGKSEICLQLARRVRQL